MTAATSAFSHLTPADVVRGVWSHGDGGFWDRVSATRALIRQRGGLGKPNETRATLKERARKLELVWISWSRQDCNDFASYAFRDSSNDSEFRQAKMHWQMQTAFHGTGNVAVEAYRGSGKTSQEEIAITWTLGKDPNKLIKLLSEGGDTASERVRNVRNHIESNRLLRHVFPGLRRKEGMPWTDQQITVQRSLIDRNPSLGGWGYNSKGVGGRANLLVGDDVIPPKAMSSPTVRRECITMWNNVWTKMLFPDSKIWFVFTPWHELDLGAKIRTNDTFQHLYYPVGGVTGCRSCPDFGGKPCGIPFHNPWAPHLWSSEKLRGIYRRDGSLSYSRSHLLIPLASELSLFPEQLFVGVKRADLVMGKPWRWWAAHGIRRVFGVDLALGAGTGHDWFVIFCLGFDERGHRYVVDILHKQSADYRVQLQWVADFYARHRPELIFVEGTQYQRVFSSMLQNTTALPVKAFYPLGAGKGRRVEGADKRDLKFGVPGLRIHLENKKYHIPYGDEYSRDLADIYINELKHFAISEDGKVQGVGAHDDTAMAGWIADQAALRLGAGMGIDADLGDDLEGLEDYEIGGDLYRPPDLGRAVESLLADGAGVATSVQVPDSYDPTRPEPTRPETEIYDIVWNRSKPIKTETLDNYLRMLGQLNEPPTVVALVKAGFSPRDSGKLAALVGRYGVEACIYVFRDRITEILTARVVANQDRLLEITDEEEAALDEEDGMLSLSFGGVDAGAIGSMLPAGTEGVEVPR